MIDAPRRPLRIAWLAPDDKGGGVVSVVQLCCHQAALAGHDVTLLLALAPTGHATEFGRAKLASLNALPPYSDIPSRLVSWLRSNPQDVLILNNCEQADVAIPFLPSGTRIIYAVHDTADRYFDVALRHEAHLDGIIAVSGTVAERFRACITDQGKLHVVLNGTSFPVPLEDALVRPRDNDLVFLGGDNALKGAYDVLALWPSLTTLGFKGRLHWFGAVGEAMRGKISALQASKRIEMHGRQPRGKIFAVAARSKVVLILTRADAFGMGTVECMGMGCVPVAWDIATGTKEIVAKGEGIFVPLGNLAALAKGVMDAIEFHSVGFAASTARIRTEFSASAMWNRYAAAFDVIFSRPPSSRTRDGEVPPDYRPTMRLFQWLPAGLRSTIRAAVGRSPRIGYALRDFRGR